MEDTQSPTMWYAGLMYAAMASIGAGLIHGGAIGLHAEHPQLARLFIMVTVAQVAWGVMVMLRPRGWLLVVGMFVNAGAVAGWLATRLSGISWIDGLEVRESAQIADSLCAALGLIAAVIAMRALLSGKTEISSTPRVAIPASLVAVVAIVAMWNGATHVHAHGDAAHGDAAHGDAAHGDAAHGGVVLANWPRAFDPSLPLDISNVEGVSAEQELRAANLIKETSVKLLHWADPKTAYAEGWRSIGDTVTGFEHYQNYSLYEVYKVGLGGQRTLVSAMFMAGTKVPMDSPQLTDYAGPLMQWHIHDNLCFIKGFGGAPMVVGITNAQGECRFGTRSPGDNAMVHVWIVPHECGPFAALEGVGAGSAIVSEADRRDKCGDHTHPA
ncbi:MAG: hypothetical protein NTU52_06000 [Actinobacteria bacterium]|nr:hypothetical protein [Actinomycetota bacterium]